MHNRKFVSNYIMMLEGDFVNLWQANNAGRDIEHLIIESGFLQNAPFKWLGPTYRLGVRNELTPEYEPVDKKYGDLSFAVEIKIKILQWADSYNLQLLSDIFMIAGLESLIDVGKKYKLPLEVIRKERSKYGNIPETIEECEQIEYPPENYLISLYESGIENANDSFMRILNDTERYEHLKSYVHKIPHHIMRDIIERKLKNSAFHKPQCDELLLLIKK